MPSTFTENTGIELIADGEQSGLWGQTTNDNFDIIDRALNGSVNISLSGTTHTLTTASGVLSDGQFAVLVFTGSPSGTNTVTIAPNTAQKTYFVTNSTAQTVVLSQGSGANVSVPAGLSKIVFTNGAGAGAAVFDITNTLSGNLTGNASTATALQTARTIGGVSFNGTANINLPGVNIGGNQNTTGSAASLTTARTFTIGNTGKTFNGTANVAWSLAEIGVGTLGQQNSNNVNITGGTIDGTVIGGSTPAAISGTTGSFSGNLTVDTNTLFVDAASNNVGIGTSSPSSTLQVLTDGTSVTADAGTVGLFQRSGEATSGAIVSIVGGNTGASIVNFGDTDSQSVGRIRYDHSSNSMQFNTNGTERLRINSFGDVGIATSNPTTRLQIGQGTGRIFNVNQNTTNITRLINDRGISLESGSGFDTDIISAGTASFGHIRFLTNNTERLRITSTGSVGIGTTTLETFSRLEVHKATTNTLGMPLSVFISAPAGETIAAGSGGGIGFGGAFNGTIATVYAAISGEKANSTSSNTEGVLRFGVRRATSGANMEAARIDASGNLLVGTTVAGGAGGFTVQPFASNGAAQARFNRSDTALNSFPLIFLNNGVASGTISFNNTTTAYNTTSDYRLKEDVQPMVGASDRVLSLKPCNFAWKVDGSRVDGFLAHEAQAVVPEAVTGEKDGEEMQAIDHSKLVPLLTAALQEALKRIEALEAQLNP